MAGLREEMIMNNRLPIRFAPAVALVAILGACENEAPRNGAPEQVQRVSSALSVGTARVQLLDFVAPGKRRLPIEERVSRMGKVLMGGALDAVQIGDSGEPEANGKQTAVERHAALRVAHVAETDDLLLVNGLVADDHAVDVDVAEEGARRVFDETIARLSREVPDDFKGVDLARVKTARLHQASAQSGRPETLRTDIKAYVFSAPRTANELEVLGSEVVIAVHRSGKVASIRMRGLLPGVRPADPALAAPRERVVSSEALLRRVQEAYPSAVVQSAGLLYPVGTPADASGGRAVEPREVFVVFEKLHDGSGYGRGRRIAFSVTDRRAPGVNLDVQLQDDKGDPR
jgi:hypothetical protein